MIYPRKTDLNAKITEIETIIPIITASVTYLALTEVENTIPNTGKLVAKTECNTKISNVEKKLLIKIMTNTLLLQNTNYITTL